MFGKCLMNIYTTYLSLYANFVLNIWHKNIWNPYGKTFGKHFSTNIWNNLLCSYKPLVIHLGLEMYTQHLIP